jgi:uncharacterized membrane protein
VNKKYEKLKKHLWQFPVFMIIFSIIGLAASMILSIEKTHLLQSPEAELLCSINPVYSCQSVILSDQASILGFSNELIGIAFFGGLLALGLGMIANAKYAKWLHLLAWLGLAASMAVVIWFFYQSVFNINALCIYCSTVWFATWTLFVGYSSWLITSKTIKIPSKYQKITDLFVKYTLLVWLSLILTFVLLILNHFWYYYGQYF